jgi:hypothetical protein
MMQVRVQVNLKVRSEQRLALWRIGDSLSTGRDGNMGCMKTFKNSNFLPFSYIDM